MEKKIELLLQVSLLDVFRIVEKESSDVREYLYLLETENQKLYEHFICGEGYASLELDDWFSKSLIEYKKTGIASDRLKRKILSQIKELKEKHTAGLCIKKTNIVSKSGFIYVLKSKNLYKIGRAKNIKERIRTYETENPFGVDVLLQVRVNNYIEEESILLNRFREKQVRGEWFALNKKDINMIKKMYEI